MILSRWLICCALVMLCSSGLLAQTTGTPPSTENTNSQTNPGASGAKPATVDATKKFEAVVSMAQGLSQWALLIFAGSLVTLVGTSYYRPQKLVWRLVYLLFVPGWFWLGYSLLKGSQVQQDYLAFLVRGASTTLGDDAYHQIFGLKWAVGFFALWLFLYLIWWVFTKEIEHKLEKSVCKRH